MDDARTSEWIVIGLMGVVTLATRIAGVGMARWIPQTPFWRSFVSYLPATLLVAIAAPVFASGDPALTAAATLTLLCAAVGLHLVVCMGVGIGSVALLRLLLP
jgi:uncharacterized membrane protein